MLVTNITKLVSRISRTLNLGNGSTWSGHLALKLNPDIVTETLKGSNCKIILIAGTNGKTTTTKMLEEILRKNGKKTIHNNSGANLLNGIAASIILATDTKGRLAAEYGVFEVDEASLPLVLKQLVPDYLILLNLFRDQLDRYGEVNTIAEKWRDALTNLPAKTSLVLNADDPQIAYLSTLAKGKSFFFGLEGEKGETKDLNTDSIYCPRCHEKLSFSRYTFSHLGTWDCPHCKLKRPTPEPLHVKHFPLSGDYNRYNTLAAILTGAKLGIDQQEIEKSLTNFQPAFGRQEVLNFKNRKVKLFLSKNPTSFNQSLEAIMEEKPKTLLFVLNDKIPDGRDTSWIWDTDLERYNFQDINVFVSGDRAYEMAVRLKYAAALPKATLDDLASTIDEATSTVPENETLYVLPNYSAMLDVRNVIQGRKIL